MTTLAQRERKDVALEIGDLVRVRTRLHLVEDVTRPTAPEEGTVVKLRCLDDDALQRQDVVVWESEPDAELVGGDDWTRSIRGFDDPATFAAFFHTQRWQAVRADAQRLRVQAPFRSGIALKWYQLEPLRRALALPRVRLFIADDVGLGKTIEAGLIIRELLCRQRLRRVVVAAPASVCDQWVEEMEDKFGLSFQLFDAEWIANARRRHGYHVNPWRLHTRFVISHERLRMEAYSQPLEDWLAHEGDAGLGAMLVLDEAHHAAPAGDSASADAGNLLQTVERLSSQFEHKLFLSATPHNGYSRSFAKLLHLLDEHRFPPNEPVPDEPKAKAEFMGRLRQVFVRRLKVDLRELGDSDDPLPTREIVAHNLRVSPQSPEWQLPDLIREYNESRRQQALQASAKGDVQNLVGLVGKILLKRALSSSDAFRRTLVVHRDRLTGAASAEAGEASEPWEDTEKGETAREGKDARKAARKLRDVLPLQPDQLALLERMERLATRPAGELDPKVQHFLAWLDANLCPGLLGNPAQAHWAGRRVIVFSEYVDTIRMIRAQLEPLVFATKDGRGRIAVMTGEDGAVRDRTRLRDLFNADPAHNPIRILLCTDAAREGINLQRHCADLFHFDLPWNPARLEQRNGRIDRFGQPSAVVRCHYFAFHDRPIDEVLRRLVDKTQRISGEGVDLAPLIARSTAAALDKVVFRETIGDLVKELDEARLPERERQAIVRALADARTREKDLRQTQVELQTLLEQSRLALGFTPDALRKTLDAALVLLGHTPLQPLGQDSHWFAFPQLDRQGADGPAWQTAIDALRPRRDASDGDDRAFRAQPPRPVALEAPRGAADGEVVQLHLEHAVVRRLLGRFVAQGFVRDQLHRACVLQAATDQPVVLALARLTLHGPTGAKLHDEVVLVSADWLPATERAGRGRLRVHPRAQQSKWLGVLEHALTQPIGSPTQTRETLVQTVVDDLAELEPELRKLASEAAEAAAGSLQRDAKAAADATYKMLQDQVQRLQSLLQDAERHNPRLLDLMDNKPDLAGSARSWSEQLAKLTGGACEALPKAVTDAAEVKQHRIQPVGVVYLWPQRGPA